MLEHSSTSDFIDSCEVIVTLYASVLYSEVLNLNREALFAILAIRYLRIIDCLVISSYDPAQLMMGWDGCCGGERGCSRKTEE